LTYSDKLSEQKQNEDIKDALKQKRIEEKEMKHEVGPLKCSKSISPQLRFSSTSERDDNLVGVDCIHAI
jgi:hypothetical protein